jgi:hypothetical protein
VFKTPREVLATSILLQEKACLFLVSSYLHINIRLYDVKKEEIWEVDEKHGRLRGTGIMKGKWRAPLRAGLLK